VKTKAQDEKKTYGVHYTPVELAEFLARVTQDAILASRHTIRILDPACGDVS